MHTYHNHMNTLLSLALSLGCLIFGCSVPDPGTHQQLSSVSIVPEKSIPEPPTLNECNISNDKAQPLLIHVLADNSFPQSQQILITRAYDDWSIATEGLALFAVSFVPAPDLLEQPDTPTTSYVWNGAPYTPDTLGHTVWYPNTLGSVIHIQSNITDNSLFYTTVLHEVGHSLNIPHISDAQPAIMSDPGTYVETLTCADLQAFCKAWACE